MANENYWLRNDGCLYSFIRWKTQIAFNFKILPNNLGQYDEIGEGKLSIVPRYTYNILIIYIYIYCVLSTQKFNTFFIPLIT